MPQILIEAAIDSVESAERAVREGAHRLEVCANLHVGGLTPSPDLLRACLALGVPCVAMARPRAGDFIYDDADRARLHAMVQAMGDAGADGVVFGILTTNYTIDADALRDLVAMCANRESVFHRAFDQTPDALEALDTLISCGVTRILTSGHAPIATEGAATIAELLTRAAGKIQILPGSGVRANNVVALVQRTRVTQVHARATEPGVIARIKAAIDASTSLGA